MKTCGGKRVPAGEYLADVPNMRRCLRCGCASAYDRDVDRRCPVLRGELWKPRPTSEGSWDA
jgi:hypothetical protein